MEGMLLSDLYTTPAINNIIINKHISGGRQTIHTDRTCRHHQHVVGSLMKQVYGDHLGKLSVHH